MRFCKLLIYLNTHGLAIGFIRKYLSADGLIEIVRHSWRREKFAELNSEYSWQDCVMSGLAIFGFKCPSLLQFEKDKVKPMIRRNLRTLYHVEKVPSDTCLRECLDKISAQQLRRPFKTVFAHLQRGKVLESFRYLDNHYIVSVDGTGQYSSEQVHCKIVVKNIIEIIVLHIITIWLARRWFIPSKK